MRRRASSPPRRGLVLQHLPELVAELRRVLVAVHVGGVHRCHADDFLLLACDRDRALRVARELPAIGYLPHDSTSCAPIFGAAVPTDQRVPHLRGVQAGSRSVGGGPAGRTLPRSVSDRAATVPAERPCLAITSSSPPPARRARSTMPACSTRSSRPWWRPGTDRSSSSPAPARGRRAR